MYLHAGLKRPIHLLCQPPKNLAGLGVRNAARKQVLSAVLCQTLLQQETARGFRAIP
jgi:hypothetical protein